MPKKAKCESGRSAERGCNSPIYQSEDSTLVHNDQKARRIRQSFVGNIHTADDFHNLLSASMYPQQCHTHRVSAGEETVQAKAVRFILELSELVPSVACCVVSTSYIHRSEQTGINLDNEDVRNLILD